MILKIREAHGVIVGCDTSKLSENEKKNQLHAGNSSAQMLLYHQRLARKSLTAPTDVQPVVSAERNEPE